jgi:RNA polymerase sigma-70 factor (ECF subfamily)
MEAFGAQLETKKLQIAEESEWVLAAQQDLKNFEPLYKRYYEPIYEYVYRRCDDSDSCVDITAVVFEKAMLNIGKFKIQGFPFGSWLYRIAASEIGNYYRLKKKERKVYVQTDGIRDIAQEFESGLADEDNLHTLLRAMEHMKPEDLELIVMRYFEKRNFTEIAGILETNESNARVKLHRVLGRLKEAFVKEGRE